MHDLYVDGTCIPFHDLSDTYGVPTAHFLKYNAVCAVVSDYWACGQPAPPTTAVLHAILSQGTARRTVTMLYTTLLSTNTTTLAELKNQCDTDVGHPLTDAQ